MHTEVVMVVDSRGVVRPYRRRSSVTLAADEVAIQMSISIPDSFFRKPYLRATVAIPETDGPPAVVDARVAEEVKSALSQHGFNVQVAVVHPEEEPETETEGDESCA